MTTQNPGCLGFLMRLFGVAPAPAGNPFPYHVQDSILTTTELAFYRVLKQAVGGTYTIACKVVLRDIFAVTPKTENFKAFHNKIDRKHIDFLLCHPETMRPVAGIELDDRSHERASAQAGDQFKDGLYQAAGLPLIRIPVQESYDAIELQGSIAAEIRDQARAPVGPSGPAVGRNVTPTVAPTPIVGQRKAPRCPKCGVAMVVRTSSKGGNQFWGCPNFPSCRQIIQIEGQ